MAPDQPFPSFGATEAAIVELRGKSHVVLTSRKKTLAVFRVRTDGLLKRLRRPPRELQPDEE